MFDFVKYVMFDKSKSLKSILFYFIESGHQMIMEMSRTYFQ